MRSVIWLVLLFVAAVVAAMTLGRNDGLVSLYFGHWRTDLSLNLFVVLVLLACALLMLAARSIARLLSLPQRAHEWRQLRNERAAQARLREGFAEYFAARYSRAHRAAQRALEIQDETEALRADAEFRLLAHLLAAASLHRLQDRPRRDELMQQMAGLLRRGSAARPIDEGVRLLAAEWAIDDRDAAGAIAQLGELPGGVARRTQALRLRLLAQRLTQQPLAALQTARLLAKHQAFSPEAAKSLLRTLALEALEAARDADTLRRTWQQLDAADRRDAAVAARAAIRAAGFGVPAEGREWLRPYWDQIAQLAPDERRAVALALLECREGIGSDWLAPLDAAAAALPNDPAVAAAVGAALVERQLWGKARRPLEQAAQAQTLPALPRRRSWRALAQLAEQEGDTERANACAWAAARID
ncbi:MAG: heme biosynthesis HemY N-terminal domain-containing protein [Rubrivivax sp.]|nr:heme biosynthesis protein HemY [Pseudomonadota bacterium]